MPLSSKLKYLKCFILSIIISSVFADGATEKQPLFSFGVVADVQYCQCEPQGTRFYSNSLLKLKECVRDFNARDLSFVIQLGDLIDRDIKNLNSVFSVFSTIQSKKYSVLGNHDYSGEETEKKKVPEILGMETRYYQFDVEGWRMIVLDGTDLSFYAPEKSSAQIHETETLFQTTKDRNAGNAQIWNGGLSSAQLSWLEESLNRASLASEKVMIFCHFPVFPSREENLWNDIELIELLESYPCVIAFLSGHLHSGGYAKKKGIHYLSLQGMVETEEQNAYSIFEVYSNHIKVLGYGREPSRILTFRTGST